MKPREDRQLTLQGFEKPVAIVAVAPGAKPRRASPNADLVGRSFSDGTSEVFVRGVSTTNPTHVVVERERDGHSWTIHAGVVRMIVGRTRRQRAA
ncbi:MAG: hypothetical protein QOF61_573 [Acidobacteriota bacterium]|nr:hypothetical protein [Acidobacteriota bacterium]